MKSNQLPYKYTLTHSLLSLIRWKKKGNNILEEHGTSGIKERVLITNIANCENEKIIELFEPLEEYRNFLSVFLHGSWADNTRTAYSDIDDFIVLNIYALRKAKLLKRVIKLLNRIDMKYCRIDPIQHHGHWIVSDQDLLNYDNSFIPIHILKDSKKVIGENCIEAFIESEKSYKGLKLNILRTCDNINKLSRFLFDGNINAYQLKALVGSFALMPAFIYQVEGLNYNKPEAIEKANELYSTSAFKCIKWSTACRNNWFEITRTNKYKTFSLFPYLFLNPHLWRRFSKKFSPIVSHGLLKKLSQDPLSKSSVENFIEESSKYAKK